MDISKIDDSTISVTKTDNFAIADIKKQMDDLTRDNDSDQRLIDSLTKFMAYRSAKIKNLQDQIQQAALLGVKEASDIINQIISEGPGF